MWEKREVLDAIKQYYESNKNEVESQKPFAFSDIQEMAQEENLINVFFSDLFDEDWGKIVKKEREVGVVTYITLPDYYAICEKAQGHSLDLIDQVIREQNFQSSVFKKKDLFSYTESRLTDVLKKSMIEYRTRLSVLSGQAERQYILSEIELLLSLIIHFYDKVEKVIDYDKKYYRFIVSLISESLQEIILNNFHIIPTSLKKKLKKYFPSLITFLDGKMLISSFEGIAEEWKLNALSYHLIKEKVIDKIETTFFMKIFKNEYITDRINWIWNKSDLSYFVKRLEDLGYIKSSKNIWQKASHCFMLKSLDIDSKSLSWQKLPAEKKQKRIDSIFSKIQS